LNRGCRETLCVPVAPLQVNRLKPGFADASRRLPVVPGESLSDSQLAEFRRSKTSIQNKAGQSDSAYWLAKSPRSQANSALHIFRRLPVLKLKHFIAG
jgi:hypothetical protein